MVRKEISVELSCILRRKNREDCYQSGPRVLMNHPLRDSSTDDSSTNAQWQRYRNIHSHMVSIHENIHCIKWAFFFQETSPLNAAHMRQGTGPACSVPSHYLNHCWLIVNGTPGNRFQWNLNRNYIIFIEENAFDNVVCKNDSHFVQGEELTSTMPNNDSHDVFSGVCFLTQWGRDQIDAISQTTFSYAFSRMKMNEFRLGFHWSLFLRLEWTIFQHWFR